MKENIFERFGNPKQQLIKQCKQYIYDSTVSLINYGSAAERISTGAKAVPLLKYDYHVKEFQ